MHTFETADEMRLWVKDGDLLPESFTFDGFELEIVFESDEGIIHQNSDEDDLQCTVACKIENGTTVSIKIIDYNGLNI